MLSCRLAIEADGPVIYSVALTHPTWLAGNSIVSNSNAAVCPDHGLTTRTGEFNAVLTLTGLLSADDCRPLFLPVDFFLFVPFVLIERRV